MGIGVSYTGANGKRKDFNVGNVDALQAVMSQVSPRRSMRGVDATQVQPFTPEQKKDFQTKGGSAIVKDFRGELCLRGEEGDALVEGRRYYCSLNGRKGYFTIGEIDPPVHGKMCGKWMNTETKPDSESHEDGDGSGAFSIPISRTSCELTSDGLLRVINFYRELKFSGDGRMIGVTEESASQIGEFKCGLSKGEGGGNGSFCVLPVFDGSGKLTSLRFGTEQMFEDANYSALDEIKTVGVSEYDPTVD